MGDGFSSVMGDVVAFVNLLFHPEITQPMSCGRLRLASPAALLGPPVRGDDSICGRIGGRTLVALLP
jgi:hypothetical protein